MVFGLAAALGCDAHPVGGGLVDYRSTDGTFSLSYVTPPWEVSSETEALLQLEIPAELFGVSIEGSPPTHALRAGHVDEVGGLYDFDIEGLDGFLPEDLPEDWEDDIPDDWDGDIPDDVPEDWEGDLPDDLPDELPDYLRDVDLTEPRDVAFAEINFLVLENEAELDGDLSSFISADGTSGVVFQVVHAPGIFIRSFYFPSSTTTVRVVFASLFDLQTIDVDDMAATISTDGVKSE